MKLVQSKEERIKKQQAKFREANREKLREYAREHYKKNKEKKLQYQREWRDANRDHVNEYARKYVKERRKTDPAFRKQACVWANDYYKWNRETILEKLKEKRILFIEEYKNGFSAPNGHYEDCLIDYIDNKRKGKANENCTA